MIMEQTATFKTRDLNFTAALVESGGKFIKVVNQGGSGLFCLEDDPNLRSLARQYLAKELRVQPQSFLATWKKLRTALAEALGKGKT
jgi:hypothetical protein